MPYSSRWGRFHISGHTFNSIRGQPDSEAFRQALSLMSHVFIVEAHHSGYDDEIDYLGISPLFDELAEGQMPPDYILEGITHRDEQDDGTIKVSYEVKAFRREPRCLRCGRA